MSKPLEAWNSQPLTTFMFFTLEFIYNIEYLFLWLIRKSPLATANQNILIPKQNLKSIQLHRSFIGSKISNL